MRMKLSHFLIATMALSLAACGQQSLPDTTVKDAGLGDAFYSSFEAFQPGMSYPANAFDADRTSSSIRFLAFNPLLYGVSVWNDPTITPHSGNHSLKFTANLKFAPNPKDEDVTFRMNAFDVNIPVNSGTFIEYWVLPKSDSDSCASISLDFTNGLFHSNLLLRDQNGKPLEYAVTQCNTMNIGQWNYRKFYISTLDGSSVNDWTIDRITIDYQNSARRKDTSTGTAEVYFDDIRIGTDTPPRVFEAEGSGMYHNIGRAEADGWSATSGVDQTGHLSYGPYVTDLRAGLHTATFRMLIGNNTGTNYNAATVGVWDSTKQTMLGVRTIYRNEWGASNTYQDFALDFRNDNPGDELSFLVYWYNGVTYLKLDKITVY
jgi:hypothetical protein